MNEDELSAYIIHHLTEGDDPKDLVLDICEKTNRSWPQAEALVKRVQEENEGVIARKQFPLLFVLAFAIFAAGLGLVGYALYFIFAPLLAGQTGSPMAVVNYTQYLLEVLTSSHGTIAFALVIGPGMILGSLIGMRDVWAKVLTK